MNILENSSSIIKVLLIFYLLIGNSALQPLLSKQWRNLVEDNRMVQHIIGFTTIVALVALVGEYNNTQIIIYSLFGYIWFLFSTKMDIHWNVIVIVLLLLAYLYDNSNKMKNTEIELDKVLTHEEKMRIKKQNNSNMIYVLLGIFGLTILGMFMYSNKKEVQYGGSYGLVNFLLY